MNEKERGVTILEEIKSWQMKAIELRYDGYTYKDCQRILENEFPDMDVKFSEGNLRKLFYSKGLLREHFEQYSKIMNEESVSEGQNAIKSAHKIAGKTIVALMNAKYPSNVRLSAAKEIFDRNEGKSKERMEISTPMDELRKEYFDAIKEIKADEHKQGNSEKEL